MTPMQITFLVFAALTLACGVMVVTVRRMMHAALWLVLALMGVAVLFALLESRFFAVVQVLVYIGAIAILIMFAVMLTHKIMDDSSSQVVGNFKLAILAAAGMFAGIVIPLASWDKFNTVERTVSAGGQPVSDLGKALVDPMGFAIPFEVASVLLLAAMVGSIYIAADRKGGQQE